jgi:hypothetical protein
VPATRKERPRIPKLMGWPARPRSRPGGSGWRKPPRSSPRNIVFSVSGRGGRRSRPAPSVACPARPPRVGERRGGRRRARWPTMTRAGIQRPGPCPRVGRNGLSLSWSGGGCTRRTGYGPRRGRRIQRPRACDPRLASRRNAWTSSKSFDRPSSNWAKWVAPFRMTSFGLRAWVRSRISASACSSGATES